MYIMQVGILMRYQLTSALVNVYVGTKTSHSVTTVYKHWLYGLDYKTKIQHNFPWQNIIL